MILNGCEAGDNVCTGHSSDDKETGEVARSRHEIDIEGQD